VALVLHADNGGGNNSTFTNHVVTSSGTDTYSAIAAAMASLKGPRHGGANNKVMAMMDDIKENISDWNDDGCVADYLTKMLNKEAFDRSGLIYGLGHAVYTKTDPRCEVFRDYVTHLAEEKGRQAELALYANVERIGKQLLMERPHKSWLSTKHRLLQRLRLRDAGPAQWSCTRPCSPWPGSRAGAPTGWKSCP
jgi:citrate synthase